MSQTKLAAVIGCAMILPISCVHSNHAIPADSEGLRMEIIGHRGASRDAPENTLASVRLAWQRNADAVEIDVYLSKDNRVVVIHDKSTKRLAKRDLVVKDATLKELRTLDVGRWKNEKWAGERIPTLRDVLKTIPDGKRLFIEIKCGPEVIPFLKSDLASAGKKPEQTAVIAFSLETVTAAKKALPRLKTYWIVAQKKSKTTGKWKPSIDAMVKSAVDANLDGLDLKSTAAITSKAVQKAKDNGLSFYIWTVNSDTVAARLSAMGIDGITTDRPGWLRTRLSAQDTSRRK